MEEKKSGIEIDERKFDGRANFPADNQIELLLDEHFERFNISKLEIVKNFQIYTRRVALKKFLAHYEFFRRTIELPGDIIELGVYRGASLMSWANFLEVRCMGDRHKQVFGFDNFAGFTSFHEKDGVPDAKFGKTLSGFDGGTFEEILGDALSIFDQDRFIPYKPRVVLVKGNIEQTVPQFVKDNPGLRISLIHFDCDLYLPTKIALETFWPLVVRGGVVLFDEYGIRPWEGESNAVDEYFADKNVKIRRLEWTSAPSSYIVKE